MFLTSKLGAWRASSEVRGPTRARSETRISLGYVLSGGGGGWGGGGR